MLVPSHGGWAKVPSERVIIATLDKVDLSQGKGFTLTPNYLGVRTEGTATQDRTGRYAGSFPQSMISFLAGMEVDQFWYSTGLSTDDTKMPLPLSVSLDATDPVEPTPSPEPTESTPTVDNPVNDAPPDVAQAAPQPDQQAAADDPAAAPGLPAVVPENQRELLTPADLGAVRPVAATTSEGAGPDRTWWLVGSLLLAAALLLLVPTRPRG